MKPHSFGFWLSDLSVAVSHFLGWWQFNVREERMSSFYKLWLSQLRPGTPLMGGIINTWHIIHRAHSGFITWQIFVLFFLQLEKNNHTHCLKPGALKITCIKVQYAYWFIDVFPLFPPWNSELLGAGENCLQGFMASFNWMCERVDLHFKWKHYLSFSRINRLFMSLYKHRRCKDVSLV